MQSSLIDYIKNEMNFKHVKLNLFKNNNTIIKIISLNSKNDNSFIVDINEFTNELFKFGNDYEYFIVFEIKALNKFALLGYKDIEILINELFKTTKINNMKLKFYIIPNAFDRDNDVTSWVIFNNPYYNSERIQASVLMDLMDINCLILERI